MATPEALTRLDPHDRASAVLIVQDAFTSHFDAEVVADACALLVALGFKPWLVPYRPNGKPLHVHGFLARFAAVAGSNTAMLRDLARQGVPLVGIDPSMTLTYRSEYAQALGGGDHCTERTNAPGAVRDWQALFAHLGLRLEVPAAGCCGMAGTYGHEARHRATSETIYNASWARHVSEAPGCTLLADGYSCRSQAKLVDGVRLRHPAQVLLDHVRRSAVGAAPFHLEQAAAAAR
jgi:Fe-S oxidoreductase